MMQFKNIAFNFGMLFSLYIHLAMTEKIPIPISGNHNLLAADLFHTIVEPRYLENSIFSPVPINTDLTMSLVGAGGKTAEELRNALKLDTDDKSHIAQNFAEFLKSLLKPNSPTKAADSEFLIANRLYINDNSKISSDYKKIIEENFDVLAENVDFAENKLTLNKINDFVEQQTENKIKNLLSNDDINAQSNMVIVNGLYFKGKWKYGFDEKYIKTSDFHINEKEKKPVEMMHIKGTFNYVDFPQMEASVLELPLNDTGLKITFLLPYKIEGLKRLEKTLWKLELKFIPLRLAPKEVCVYIPKFQIEQEIDLKPILEEIGLSTLFNEKAELPGIFDAPAGHYISTFKQKSLLEIDEIGSQPASSLGPQGECGKDVITFRADHPFVFAVRSDSAIYFAGHVAKF